MATHKFKSDVRIEGEILAPNETSFSAANNQVSAVDVTGLAFASGTVRSFEALVSVYIDATSDLYESFSLLGINKGSSFDMSVQGVGDDSGYEV